MLAMMMISHWVPVKRAPGAGLGADGFIRTRSLYGPPSREATPNCHPQAARDADWGAHAPSPFAPGIRSLHLLRSWLRATAKARAPRPAREGACAPHWVQRHCAGIG